MCPFCCWHCPILFGQCELSGHWVRFLESAKTAAAQLLPYKTFFASCARAAMQVLSLDRWDDRGALCLQRSQPDECVLYGQGHADWQCLLWNSRGRLLLLRAPGYPGGRPRNRVVQSVTWWWLQGQTCHHRWLIGGRRRWSVHFVHFRQLAIYGARPRQLAGN